MSFTCWPHLRSYPESNKHVTVCVWNEHSRCLPIWYLQTKHIKRTYNAHSTKQYICIYILIYVHSTLPTTSTWPHISTYISSVYSSNSCYCRRPAWWSGSHSPECLGPIVESKSTRRTSKQKISMSKWADENGCDLFNSLSHQLDG